MTCGLDPSTIAPGDLAVAVRSYPRRFAAAMAALDEEDEARLTQRPAPGEPTAVELAGEVAARFASLAGVAPTDDLASAADALGSMLDATRGKDWERSAGDDDLLTAAREAVHTAHHHLREVEATLATLRRR